MGHYGLFYLLSSSRWSSFSNVVSTQIIFPDSSNSPTLRTRTFWWSKFQSISNWFKEGWIQVSRHLGLFSPSILNVVYVCTYLALGSRYTFLRNLLCFAYWKQIVHTQATLNTLWQKPNFRPKNTLWQIASEASYVYIWVDKSSLKKPNWNIVFLGNWNFRKKMELWHSV